MTICLMTIWLMTIWPSSRSDEGAGAGNGHLGMSAVRVTGLRAGISE